MNPLINALALINPLSDNAQSSLKEIVHFQFLPKNTDLLEIGNVSKCLYFIHKGLARVYYCKGDVDVTDYFAMDSQFIGGVKSLFTGEPSMKGIQLLEDSEVYSLAYKEFEKLCDRYDEIERIGRKLAIFAFLTVQERMEDIQFLEAKERYYQLEKKYSGIVNRVPLKFIASYLGITQVSLSRIRGLK